MPVRLPWRPRIQVDGKTFYLGHDKTCAEAEQVALEAYKKLGLTS